MQKIISFFVQSGLETYISVITERDLWRLDSLRVHCAGALALPICAVRVLLSKFHFNFIQIIYTVGKGQLISECLFDFFKFSKKPTKNLTKGNRILRYGCQKNLKSGQIII